MMQELKIFLWAGMHHEQFKHCYFLPLLSVRLNRSIYSGTPKTWTYTIEVKVRRSLTLYIPCRIENAYNEAHGIKPLYDDIPF